MNRHCSVYINMYSMHSVRVKDKPFWGASMTYYSQLKTSICFHLSIHPTYTKFDGRTQTSWIKQENYVSLFMKYSDGED